MNVGQMMWMDPQNYKPCSKKIYEIKFCKPPVGTIVINKLEQASMVRQFRRAHFTVKDIENAINNANLGSMLYSNSKGMYHVDEGQAVLGGTRGEMRTIKLAKLASKYVLVKNNAPVQITDDVLAHMMNADGCIDWTVIRTVPDNSKAFACFVPENIKGVINTSWGDVLNINDPTVRHGYGDFVIAAIGPDGSPNLNDIYVVNGEVFADTYDNRGWSKYIAPEPIGSNNSTADVRFPNLLVSGYEKGKNPWDELCNKYKQAAPVAQATTAAPQKPAVKQAPKAPAKDRANDLLGMFGGKKKSTEAVASKVPAQPASAAASAKVADTTGEKAKAGAKKKMYSLVGRDTDGTKVTGYYLQSTDGTKAGKYSREQTAYLIGSRQVVNADGQITSKGLIIRITSGTKMTDLPTSNNGIMKNTDVTGATRRGDSMMDVANRVVIVGRVKESASAREVIGYYCQNAAGQKRYIDRNTVIEQAKAGKIGNARVQMYNGKPLLRATKEGPNWSTLPILDKDGNPLQ